MTWHSQVNEARSLWQDRESAWWLVSELYYSRENILEKIFLFLNSFGCFYKATKTHLLFTAISSASFSSIWMTAWRYPCWNADAKIFTFHLNKAVNRTKTAPQWESTSCLTVFLLRVLLKLILQLLIYINVFIINLYTTN